MAPYAAVAMKSRRGILTGNRWPWELSLFQSRCTWPAFKPIRHSSAKAGEDKRGHLHLGPNERIFFLNSKDQKPPLRSQRYSNNPDIFPFSLGWTCRLPFIKADEKIAKYLERANSSIISRALPENLPIKVLKRVPRVMEGGSFVKFSHDPGVNVKKIEASLKTFLEENPVKQVFQLKRRVKASLVEGTPWIEDLFRFPSSRIKVEFLPTAAGGEAAVLSQEELFSLFRPFGRLMNVSSQPPDVKVLPSYAYLNFRAVRHAVMAKNCLHGITVPQARGGGMNGTVLRLGYEQIIKTRWIRGWLASHPRTIIPLIVFLVATMITVVVLDP